MSYHYYAATIRKLTCGLPRSEEYDAIIAALKKKYTHIDVRYNIEMVYKMNGNHNVHAHLLMKSPKPVNYRMLNSVCPAGYNSWCHTINNKGGALAWNAYISKENQEDVRAQIAYYHEEPDEQSEEVIEEQAMPTYPELDIRNK